MRRKIVALMLVIASAFTLFIPTAFAGSVPAYVLSVSSAKVNIGESVTFTLQTPVEAARVSPVLNGKILETEAQAQPVLQDGCKIWTVSFAMIKTGTHTVAFNVYDAFGKLMAIYPKTSVKITVVRPLLPPMTADVTFLEYDMAVIEAVPTAGFKYSKLGFMLGSSQDALTKNIKANTMKGNAYNKLVTDLTPNTTYYYQAYAQTGSTLLKGEIKSFTTPEQAPWTLEMSLLGGTNEKYAYLFHSTNRYYTIDRPPLGFASYSEAQKQMVAVTVPVWVISHGAKKTVNRTLYVNRKLAQNVAAMLTEVHALDIKFPVMRIRCFSYRKVRGPGLGSSRILSHHSFGAAIDINSPYNRFYSSIDRRNPKNPYTIPQQVIDVFAKYGWAWGGDFAEGLDTMHFQYLGLDLLPNLK
jgi:hypothetical protein